MTTWCWSIKVKSALSPPFVRAKSILCLTFTEIHSENDSTAQIYLTFWQILFIITFSSRLPYLYVHHVDIYAYKIFIFSVCMNFSLNPRKTFEFWMMNIPIQPALFPFFATLPLSLPWWYNALSAQLRFLNPNRRIENSNFSFFVNNIILHPVDLSLS